jgi:hypothetical protein
MIGEAKNNLYKDLVGLSNRPTDLKMVGSNKK